MQQQYNLSILHIPNPSRYHGYGTLETLLPWFPVLVFFPIVVHPLSLLAMPLLLTCGELDTMLLWYSHWNAESSLEDWMQDQGVPGLHGIDTRALTMAQEEAPAC